MVLQRFVSARLALMVLIMCMLWLPGIARGATPMPFAGQATLRPAAIDGPSIAIQNLDGVPYNDRLVFQRINCCTEAGLHNEVTIRLSNTGTATLAVQSITISGGDVASFRLNNADRQPFTLEPNVSRDVPVKFVRGSNGYIKSLRQSTLLIRSNDPVQPTLAVELAGYNMSNPDGANEPDLQEILSTFGYSTQISYPGQNFFTEKGAYTALGEEVLSAFWLRADGALPVYARQLAALHGCCTDGQAAAFRITGAGGGTFTHTGIDGQTFLPRLMGSATAPAEITINPSTTVPFEVQSAGFSSKRGALGQPHAIRFWPARDRSGALILNTYIVGQDYAGNSGANFDYQDNVYLVTNIRPADTTAVDPNKAGSAPGAATVLEFDQTSYPGTLVDKDNEAIGFPTIQRNKNDIKYPQNTPTNSYDKTLLDLDTNGQGTLNVTSAAGNNTNADNVLVNGLCLPFDGRGGTFAVTTRLVGPLTGLTTAYQQAGLMFGPDQFNHIKLTAGVQVTGPTPGKPWIQFSQELGDVSNPVSQLVSLPVATSITALDLQLVADPVAKTVQALYRVNDGIWVTLPLRATLSNPVASRFFDARANGCIITTNKNTTPITTAVDRFAITPFAQQAGGPTVSAGPDQYVATGASVTLTGVADADGAPLIGTWQQVGGNRPVVLNGTGNTRSFAAPTSSTTLTFAFAATDSQSRTATASVTITVGNAAVAGLKASASTPVTLGTATTFVASVVSGAAPLSYQWTFGDGSPAVVGGPTISHTYATVGSYQASVTASNAANSATASTTAVVQTPVPSFAFRYNVGGPTVTTPDTLTWTSDAGLFVPANTIAEQRGAGIPPIAGTENDVIYQTYRGRVPNLPSSSQVITFEIPLNTQLGIPADTQVVADVRLHFAELYWGGSTPNSGGFGPGKRVFDISLEGTRVFDDFDIIAAVGAAETALVQPFNSIKVVDGKLTLVLKAEQDYISLAAIEVLSAAGGPVVDAGTDQATQIGALVALNGSVTNGVAPLAYSWTQIGGPQAILTGNGNARSFAPTISGDYVFTLAVTDASGRSSSDSVAVLVANPTVAAANRLPLANAGPDQSVETNTPVTLTGAGSDPDGDVLTYSWVQSDGAPLTLVGNGSERTFTPTSSGSYGFILTVTDPKGLSASDSVTIVATEPPPPPNQAPAASAGLDQQVEAGSLVTIAGLGSDPDDDLLTFDWVQSGGPLVALAGSAEVRTFTPTVGGVYTFTLTIADPAGLSDNDDVRVTVTEAPTPTEPVPVNNPPVANAGIDQSVQTGSSVALTGAGSSDPDGDVLTFSWQQIGGPTVMLNDARLAQPSFTAPSEPTVLTFSLIVADTKGVASVADTVQVAVTAATTTTTYRLSLPLLTTSTR
ncbi:MAG: PKD domain-containing protein [Roseiflexaceae bacterium]|nr:PKD domain-containing protein [Roseiflexaceae bacterium]